MATVELQKERSKLYKAGFFNGEDAIRQRAILNKLNKWFFQTEIILDGVDVCITHKAGFFDTGSNAIFTPLKVCLNRAVHKTGIIPPEESCIIRINPVKQGSEPAGINYEFESEATAKEFSEFLESYRKTLQEKPPLNQAASSARRR